MPIEGLNFIAVDVETTGLKEDAEIIEIGLAFFANGHLQDTWQTFIKPTIAIPELITNLTGISNADVADAPSWEAIESTFLEKVEGQILVAHNVSFDRRKIENHLGTTLNAHWLDTHDLAKIFLPYNTSYKLTALAEYLKVENPEHHRALNDAVVCGEVLLKLIDQYKNFDPFALGDVAALYENIQSPLANILKEVAQKRLHEPFTDELSAGDTSIDATGKSPNLTFDQAEAFFETDGNLNHLISDFEYRPEQVEMLRHIKQALLEKKHAIIEAGTGTGKTLAYLLPALLWAFEHEQRVVISTNTIALQEQLYQVDLPVLNQALDYHFKAIISKGRSNYLCKRRFYDRLQLTTLTDDELLFMAGLTLWLSETTFGDREVLNLNKQEYQFWHNVCATTDTCAGRRCPFFDTCFFFENRRNAEKSQVIIVNHALLLQDTKLEQGLLPSYDYVIIDEAHHLESEATRQFTEVVDLELIRKTLRQLTRKNGLVDRLEKATDIPTYLLEKIQEKQDLLAEIKTSAQELEALITPVIDRACDMPELDLTGDKRITDKIREADWWQILSADLRELLFPFASLLKSLKAVTYGLEDEEEIELILREWTFLTDVLLEQSTWLKRFLDGDDDRYVYWATTQRMGWGNNLYLQAAYIDIMPIIHEHLFDSKESVIMTSATLAINNSLTHTAETYLLNDDEYIGFICPAPFDYQEQSMIAIPIDRKDYSKMSDLAYTQQVIRDLELLIPAIDGGMLVLFTSYAMLNKVYFALKNNHLLKKYLILGHGQDGSRSSILKTMKENEHTVVLGANTFWEGIDVKGTNLKAVVITKLPFAPPTMPIESAKAELLQSQGKNSFQHLSLPHAILRFRQGVGRLIRSQKDYGAVIILDNRVLTKNYGKKFINSLPEQPVVKDSLPNLAQNISLWLRQKKQ